MIPVALLISAFRLFAGIMTGRLRRLITRLLEIP
jgi:hypothetical protein